MVDPGNLPATRMVSRPVSSRCFFPRFSYHGPEADNLPPLLLIYCSVPGFTPNYCKDFCFRRVKCRVRYGSRRLLGTALLDPHLRFSPDSGGF